ncbi:hypothetical protein [Streptomyces fungicidicus]|uniref:Uncharacterized protein n=1 Tax=Streptomyces fungicidicus TaxID=68203 RepID=A0ACC7XX29_9ACTN|nr:hypothetical protein [Streptomyces fungicidicus]NUV74119.1 hypothetical protein [Streptomyces fungicidicus]
MAPAKTKKKQDRVGPPLDWQAPHGPVTGALSATTGALALATTGAATGMPPSWALAAGAAGALGHGLAAVRRRLPGRTIATRASTWLVAGGWTTWAVATGPLSWTALGSLATLGVGIGAATASAHLHEEARDLEAAASAEREMARQLGAERASIAAEWTDRVQRVCNVTITVVGVEQWASGAGYSIDAQLPPGGTTWDAIARCSPALSGDARLPHGCTATATPGIDQGRVIIDVTTRNVLADETAYPADYSPLSLLTGIPWGYRSNAEEILVHLREQCALVVGPTGSGKTNMVHDILAGFARCTDVLTWVIDLNAGSAGLPWVRPALGVDGVNPGVDWLAADPAEAMAMLEAAIKVAKTRKVEYQQLMADANTDLLPISSQIPQVMLVIDEGAEILASPDREMRKLGEKILEVIRIARAMGVRTVLTALGSTGTVLGNLMIRREAKTRVALTGGETEGMDLSKMFPGSRGLRVDQAPYKGSGFISTPTSPAGLFKTWRITPHQIADIVRATSDRHPTLDAPSAKAAGRVYAERWNTDRIAWVGTSTPTPPAPPALPAPGPAGGLNLSAHRNQQPSAGAGTADEDALAKLFREQIDAEFATAPEPRPGPKAEPRAASGLNLSAHRDQQPPADTDAGAKDAALVLIERAGKAGTGASALARQLHPDYGTARSTVHEWLQEWVQSGDVIKVGSGTKTRYVHRSQHTPD